MNIREVVGLDPNYSEINREERNYAAVFYPLAESISDVKALDLIMWQTR